MGVGQLSESDAVDALRLPFYSSSHPTGSHGWRNQFDLGNPDYMPPRVGNDLGLVATDGSSVHDTRFADEVQRLAKLVEMRIIEDYPRTYEKARQLGYHFKEPVSFVLSQTKLGVYWDILEPNSHYRFRIWRDDVDKAALDTGS